MSRQDAREKLAGTIGDAAARALMESRGGTMVSIPPRYSAGLALAALIGEPAMARLVAARGGRRIYVPLYEDRTARRDQELRHLVASGTSRQAAARLFGITERRVRQILGE